MGQKNRECLKNKIVAIMTVFGIVFPTIVFGSNAQVYYCSDTEVIGFSPVNNYQQRRYDLKRFQILIDVEKKTIKSRDILFLGIFPWDACLEEKDTEQLYCFNQTGSSFSLNTKTMKYHRAYIINASSLEDDIFIAHGKCELF